jgi:peptidoglycan hydrolase FlgJ
MSVVGIAKTRAVNPEVTSKEVDQKLRDVSSLYEKQFLREMVKAMRNTVQKSELTPESMGEGIFREQLDHQYVETWGDQGGVGLADVIYNQLQERFNGGPKMFPPAGPVPIDGGTQIKIEESKPIGIPVVPLDSVEAANPATKKLTYQMLSEGRPSDITAPWAGTVMQSFSDGEGQQTLRLRHDNGLVSTLHFSGRSEDLSPGHTVEQGQRVGVLSSNHRPLTWQIQGVG